MEATEPELDLGYNRLRPDQQYGGNNDDSNMMEVILKGESPTPKQQNGHAVNGNHSNTNTGGLPGVRSRTRQTFGQGKPKANLSSHQSIFKLLTSLSLFRLDQTANTTSSNSINTMGSDRYSNNKAIIADTADDETVDFLLKSAMTVPKGQPPKKRTKKYGERKSCKSNDHTDLFSASSRQNNRTSFLFSSKNSQSQR